MRGGIANWVSFKKRFRCECDVCNSNDLVRRTFSFTWWTRSFQRTWVVTLGCFFFKFLTVARTHTWDAQSSPMATCHWTAIVLTKVCVVRTMQLCYMVWKSSRYASINKNNCECNTKDVNKLTPKRFNPTNVPNNQREIFFSFQFCLFCFVLLLFALCAIVCASCLCTQRSYEEKKRNEIIVWILIQFIRSHVQEKNRWGQHAEWLLGYSVVVN